MSRPDTRKSPHEKTSLLGNSQHESAEKPFINVEEIRHLIALAWPILVTFILQTSIGIVAISFVGQIGTVELAAASLGNMFANIMGFSVGIGFASAIDTLCSQAYGAGNFKIIGIVCQRAVWILTLLAFPLGLIWFWSENILVKLGQDAEVSRLTGLYMRYQIIGLWPGFMYTIMNKFLQTQRITRPSMIVMVIVAIVSPLLAWAFIFPFGWGFEGAALSVSICRVLQCVLLFTYIWGMNIHKKCWDGWSIESFKCWGEFLALGFPGCVMICAEWWASELLTLAAGWIGTEQLGAQAVLNNTTGFLFSFPLSISIACSIRVGNQLGSGSHAGAKVSSRSSFQLTLFVMGVLALLMVLTRDYFPYIFTKDPLVVQLVANLLPVVAVYEVFDGLQITAAGALRGCGKQKIGAIGNLVSYYVVGIPLSFLCAFYSKFDLGLTGLWTGSFTGNFVQFSILAIAVCLLNWKKEAAIASKRHAIEDTSTIDLLPPSTVTPTARHMHIEPTILDCVEDNFEMP